MYSIIVACSIVKFIVCEFVKRIDEKARGAGTAHIRTLWLFDEENIAVSGVFQRAKPCPVHAVYFLFYPK